MTTTPRPTSNPASRLTYCPGHQPNFVLPSEVQYRLSQSAQHLQTQYPQQNLNEIQAALETWLMSAIETLATNATWHCHSGHPSFALARLSFQTAMQEYSEVELID
jgi:hypothetical protein